MIICIEIFCRIWVNKLQHWWVRKGQVTLVSHNDMLWGSRSCSVMVVGFQGWTGTSGFWCCMQSGTFLPTYVMPYHHTQTSSTGHQWSIRHLSLRERTARFCNGSSEWRCCGVWHLFRDHGWQTWCSTHQTHEQQVWRHMPPNLFLSASH